MPVDTVENADTPGRLALAILLVLSLVLSSLLTGPAGAEGKGTRVKPGQATRVFVMAGFTPDCAFKGYPVIAVEKLYAHYKHPLTGVIMGHARGVVLLNIQRAGLELVELAATEVKRSLTGNGHASKRQMQHGVQAQLALPAPPEPPDVADAIAIALCALRRSAR